MLLIAFNELDSTPSSLLSIFWKLLAFFEYFCFFQQTLLRFQKSCTLGNSHQLVNSLAPFLHRTYEISPFSMSFKFPPILKKFFTIYSGLPKILGKFKLFDRRTTLLHWRDHASYIIFKGSCPKQNIFEIFQCICDIASISPDQNQTVFTNLKLLQIVLLEFIKDKMAPKFPKKC